MRPSLAYGVLKHSLPQPALRQGFSRPRFSSTTNETTQKKAQDTLASAQANVSKIWESTKKFLEPAGRKVGNLLGSYKEPLAYNLAVTKEVMKQIYIAESLQPPTVAAIRTAYASLWSQISTPAALRSFAQNGQVAKISIYGLQAYGIFKIGEMIGRRHIVGYNIH